jgi:hypothetical protein
MPIQRYKPEQIVTMSRQIEVSIANGKSVLHDNLDKCAFYAAFWKATNSVFVAANRCAFSSR